MNRIQLCGLLCADPDIRIKKTGAMRAHLFLETYASWQEELGEWRYSADLHHITVYKEEYILFLQDRVRQGDQIFIQGILTYGDKDESSYKKKRSLQIIVPRSQGLIFQVKDNQTLPKTTPALPFIWRGKLSETANENKPQKNVDETE